MLPDGSTSSLRSPPSFGTVQTAKEHTFLPTTFSSSFLLFFDSPFFLFFFHNLYPYKMLPLKVSPRRRQTYCVDMYYVANKRASLLRIYSPCAVMCNVWLCSQSHPRASTPAASQMLKGSWANVTSKLVLYKSPLMHLSILVSHVQSFLREEEQSSRHWAREVHKALLRSLAARQLHLWY